MIKEFHPVFEEYICDYVDNSLGLVEREAFEEVLVYDDDLRSYVNQVRKGKELLSLLSKMDCDSNLNRTIEKNIDQFCRGN